MTRVDYCDQSSRIPRSFRRLKDNHQHRTPFPSSFFFGTTRNVMTTAVVVLGLLLASLPVAYSKTAAAVDNSNTPWSMNKMLRYPILSRLSPRDHHQQQLRRHTEEVLTNNSLEDEDDIAQVAIQDFKVLLTLRQSDSSSNAMAATAFDHDALTDEIENTILQEFAQELVDKDVTVSYVQLIGPVSDGTGGAGKYNDENANSDILVFPGGAAVFEGTYVPTRSQLDVWIQQAVEGQLVSNLHAQSSMYDSIQKATYLSDRVVSGVQQDVDKNSGGDDIGGLLPIVLGAGIGGVVVLALLALLVTRKRRKLRHSTLAKHQLDSPDNNDNHAREITTGDLSKDAAASPAARTSADDSLEEDDRDSPRHGMARQIFPSRMITDEAKSVGAGSESSFTVGSEAGDSTGLKSASFQNYDAPPMVAKESFEHERRVTLRKDMLTSTWVGQVSTHQGRPGQIESVLEPSHFTASQERRSSSSQYASQRQQQQQDATDAWANGEDVDPSSSLRFESSSGDDAYLQRPMQRNGQLV